jgi:hypothetical protein
VVGSSCDEESPDEVDYSQTMQVGTHESENDSTRSESGKEQEVGNLSPNFSWTDINSFQSEHEVFCDVQGPQSDHTHQ